MIIYKKELINNRRLNYKKYNGKRNDRIITKRNNDYPKWSNSS